MTRRLRTIKPGFFENEDLCTLSPLTRLLFAGLWVIADREGRVEDRPLRIKSQILPYDDCDVEPMLQALAERRFILRYRAGDSEYIAIPTWAKHQRPHRRESESTIPAPSEPESVLRPVLGPSKDMPEHDEGQDEPRGNLELGTWGLDISDASHPQPAEPTAPVDNDPEDLCRRPSEEPVACELVTMPDTIRDDAEYWPYVVAVLGEKGAGAVFNLKAGPQSHAGRLHAVVEDLCSYMRSIMGGLSCEERYPLCRKAMFSALGRIATADNPAAMATFKLKRQSVGEYVSEDLLAECREHERTICGAGSGFSQNLLKTVPR